MSESRARSRGCKRRRRMPFARLRSMVLTGLVATAASVFAATPRLIPFQGRLLDAGGQPRNGEFQMTFAIYDAATGGTPQWSEVQQHVSVNNGEVNVLLGSVTPLDDPNDDG